MLRLPSQPQEEAAAGSPPEPAGDRLLGDLVRRIRAKVRDEEAFRELDRILRPWLLTYYLRASFDHADAEELVQNALSRVYMSMDGLQEEARFLPWFFKIARNVKLSGLERKRRQDRRFTSGFERLEETPDPRPGGAGAMGLESLRGEGEEELARLQAALEKLPPQQKRCLLLRVDEELSYDEIAKVLRLSVNTVRNHLQAARKSLRELLKMDFEELDEA